MTSGDIGMKITFLTLTAICFLLSAKAQKSDTTVYQGCKPPNDREEYIRHGAVLEADACPQFKNGVIDIFKFIDGHKRYPLNAIKKHIEGTVVLSMIIEKNGSISHITIAHSVMKDLDNEAVRVVSLMPKWKPAIFHRKLVRDKFFIPIKF
jgi:TonB family protein